MPGNEIDPELMGRVAERLEESGRALKSISAQNARLLIEVAGLRSEVTSAHARLKTIEAKLDGNGGGRGLRTDFELMKKDIETTQKDVTGLESWKSGITDKKVTELQTAHKEGKSNIRNTVLTLVAIIIALGSMVSSCGPQWIKAWNPPAASGSTK